MAHVPIDPDGQELDATTLERPSPASLNQANIRAGWVRADSLRQDAHQRMLSAQSQLESALPRAFDGRTPAEAYHYWDGVVDAYAAMQRELLAREGRS
jgi:hypothetical protein